MLKVVKLGGNELDQPDWLAACGTALKGVEPLVVVHGGGRAVSALSERLGLPVEKRGGLRVTSPDIAAVVEMVMGGPANRVVVDALRRAGIDAMACRARMGDCSPPRRCPSWATSARSSPCAPACLTASCSRGSRP